MTLKLVSDGEPLPLARVLQAVRDAQLALAEYVAPGGPGEADTINRLLGILDHEKVIEAVQSLRSEPSLDLIAGLAETAAAGMIANYSDEDWQDTPEIEELRQAAELLRAAGREVPHVVLDAIERGGCRGTA